MLVIEGITRRFDGRAAVEDVSLRVEAGAFVGLVGRSGAGKSTLLRTVNRLVEPDSGRISWRGLEVSGLRGRALRRWRGRCATVFQGFNLCGRLDVLSNVLVGRLAQVPAHRALLGSWPARDRALALDALRRLNVAELAAQRADRLSGGQQQRVALARALVQEPEIILADEPVASLDPRNAELVMEALARLNRENGITVLCSLHSPAAARRYCGRVVGLRAGRVAFDGAAAALDGAALRGIYGADEAEPPRPA